MPVLTAVGNKCRGAVAADFWPTVAGLTPICSGAQTLAARPKETVNEAQELACTALWSSRVRSSLPSIWLKCIVGDSSITWQAVRTIKFLGPRIDGTTALLFRKRLKVGGDGEAVEEREAEDEYVSQARLIRVLHVGQADAGDHPCNAHAPPLLPLRCNVICAGQSLP